MRPFARLLPAVLLAATAPVAAAQPATAQAEALFLDGKRLLNEGKLAEACAAFEGSFRKDPATSTLLNVADCREKNGQFASAWGAFVEAGRRSRDSTDPAHQAIDQLAQARAQRLEPRLSFLTVSVPDDSRVAGLTITRDGEPVDAAEWNRAIPTDIGPHEIEAKAPAYEPWLTSFVITAEREQRAITVPKFKLLPEDKREPNVIRLVEPSPFTPKRKLAVGLGAGGIVAVGGGLALYFLATSDYDESKRTVDDAQQEARWKSANQKLLASQLAFGLGAVALGTASYLWVTGKPTVTAESALTFAPALGPDRAGVTMRGAF